MIFEEGWADFADRRYSIVVFSKVSLVFFSSIAHVGC